MDLFVEAERCSVCRLPPDAPWPTPPPGATLYSATRTADELSVVCHEGDEPARAQVEDGWRALRVLGPLAFDLVGVITSITAPLSSAGIGLFVVSTYDTDLVLVKEGDLERTTEALLASAHRVLRHPD